MWELRILERRRIDDKGTDNWVGRRAASGTRRERDRGTGSRMQGDIVRVRDFDFD